MATSIYIVAAHQVRRRYAIDIQFLYFYVIFIHSSPVGSAIATPMHFSGHRNYDAGVVIVMPNQICQKHKIIFLNRKDRDKILIKPGCAFLNMIKNIEILKLKLILLLYNGEIRVSVCLCVAAFFWAELKLIKSYWKLIKSYQKLIKSYRELIKSYRELIKSYQKLNKTY